MNLVFIRNYNTFPNTINEKLNINMEPIFLTTQYHSGLGLIFFSEGLPRWLLPVHHLIQGLQASQFFCLCCM
jgi:hypothetical protein